MLILPMERTFDFKRLPLVTWTLILLNILVFFLANQHDERRMQQALADYRALQILPVELIVYQRYLQDSLQLTSPWLDVASLDDLSDFEVVELAQTLLLDTQYQAFAEQLLPEFVDGNYELVADRMAIVDTHIETMVWRKYGYTPGKFSIITPFTSEFLHGDWVHLLGNMVILLIIGMTVEQLFGSFVFLLFYLMCGALGALTYGVVNWGSEETLVGASGAISGLMGMYVVAYGMKKIRFFYFIGIYFNYFRATALLMLPIWLGKEMFDYFFTESNVAYTAHAGGLAAGAGLAYLGRLSALGAHFGQVDQEVLDNKDVDEGYRQQLNSALQAITRADFAVAKKVLWRLAKAYPKDHRVLFHLYQVEKTRPNTKAYHLSAMGYLKSALASGQLEKEEIELINEYWDSAQPRPMIQGNLLNKIVHKAVAKNQMKLAEKLFNGGVEYSLLQGPHLKDAAQVMKQKMLQKDRARAAQFDQYLN